MLRRLDKISNNPSSGIHRPLAGRKTTRGLRLHLLAAPAECQDGICGRRGVWALGGSKWPKIETRIFCWEPMVEKIIYVCWTPQFHILLFWGVEVCAKTCNSLPGEKNDPFFTALLSYRPDRHKPKALPGPHHCGSTVMQYGQLISADIPSTTP